MIKPALKIAIIMPRIDQRDYFLHLFRLKYKVVPSKNPDIVLYDDYSKHLIPPQWMSKILISFTGESAPIDYKLCNFSLSFDEEHDRSIYLPLWNLFIDWFNTGDPYYCKLDALMFREPVEKIKKTHFCGFVAQNSVPFRNAFVQNLSKYKTVMCPGAVLNNHPPIGGRMGVAKERFLNTCKFTVAFENKSRPGYITEKILHAFGSRTVPIYWGSPSVSKYFNKRAFINAHDYGSMEEVIEAVKEIDSNDEKYLAMLNEPVFVGGIVPKQFYPSIILKNIEENLKKYGN